MPAVFLLVPQLVEVPVVPVICRCLYGSCLNPSRLNTSCLYAGRSPRIFSCREVAKRALQLSTHRSCKSASSKGAIAKTKAIHTNIITDTAILLRDAISCQTLAIALTSTADVFTEPQMGDDIAVHRAAAAILTAASLAMPSQLHCLWLQHAPAGCTTLVP